MKKHKYFILTYNMSLANYSGKQADISSAVKSFYVLPGIYAHWIYKNILTKGYITPENKTKNVLIEKDLIVNGSIISPSDANVKKNIQDVSAEDINNISLLKAKRYNYIDEENNEDQPHYGFIAQELEEIYPNLIISIPNIKNVKDENSVENEIKGINYIELIPILVAKINNMQFEMNEMKKEMNKLKDKLST